MKIRLFLVLCLLCSPSHAVKLGQKADDPLFKLIENAAIEAPKDQEVCFSPGGNCDVKLERFMESAKTSIDVAIYDINLENVVDELIAKSKLILVRVIADKRQSKGKRSLIPYLIDSGIDVRYGRQRGILHDKFTIIDDKIVEAGSFNYTNHASKANQENQFYNANPNVVGQYQHQFEKMWNNASVPQNMQAVQHPVMPLITAPVVENKTSPAQVFDGFIHY